MTNDYIEIMGAMHSVSKSETCLPIATGRSPKNEGYSSSWNYTISPVTAKNTAT
jgi:hypothetical protein